MMLPVESEPEGPFFVCAGCDRPVDPADPDVQRWLPLRRLPSMAGPQIVAGLGEYFHKGCFPGGHYRLDAERDDLA